MLRRLALPLLVLACACSNTESREDYGAVVTFDSTKVRITTPQRSVMVDVELAVTPEQRTMGLMERTSLRDSAGMLFVYPADQPATAGFWMFRTRIPLDIAFVDSTGIILVVLRMEPCQATLASGCPGYEPGKPYRAALEVNAGFFARNGIAPGARVELPRVQAR